MSEQFTRLTAIAAPYEPVNVDTDQILPARFLKYPRSAGYAKFLFHDLREAPGFVLDRAPYDKARIFVANSNFGCGSSREGAAFVFRDAGFRFSNGNLGPAGGRARDASPHHTIRLRWRSTGRNSS